MTKVTAICSMLHEPSAPSSATRFFRQQPVLAWTLQRLRMSQRLDTLAIICWEDQLEAVADVAAVYDAHVLAKGPRIELPPVNAIAASRRFADGWRGGLLGACDFDLGFHGSWTAEVMQNLESDAVLLVDPSAALVDAAILDGLIDRCELKTNQEILFTQAPPGLGGALLRRALVERLAQAGSHPGRLLSYQPDQPARDLIGAEACVPIPTPVARSTQNFRLDSDRQVLRLTEASITLNGQLVKSNSQDLLNRLVWAREVDAMPREVVLELNTDRATSPIYWPGKHFNVYREPMSLDVAKSIFEQLTQADDVRVTLGGVGDPLLHPQFSQILDAASAAGIHALHVETDLLPASSDILTALAQSCADIVSVFIPATSAKTYQAVMGVECLGAVIENLRQFATARLARAVGTPVLAPVFIKCAANLHEMEAWYDQWLRAVGAAVIAGPSTYANLIPDSAVAEMSPALRRPCGRLWQRMTILADGSIASCEQDVTARQVLGTIHDGIGEIWRNRMNVLRDCHRKSEFTNSPACAACKEWHRP